MNLDELTLTPATSEEIESILKLYNDLLDTLDKDINYPKWTKGLYPEINYLNRVCGDGELYIAKINDDIVGSVVLNEKTIDDYNNIDWSYKGEPEEILAIHTFAVADKLRGQGIGFKMVEEIKKLAKNQNYKAIHFDTIKGNTPAERFYEKAGFTNLGEHELHYEETPERIFTLFELNL